MPDAPTFQAPPEPPAAPAPPAEPVAPTDPPPWGDDFDPSKAWKLIQNLREENKQRVLDPETQAKLDEYDKIVDAQKSDQQKAAEAKQAADERATSAEARLLRYEVAAAKELPPDLVQFLTGSTQEDIEKQADALVARLGEVASTRAPSFDGGARTTSSEPDMNAAIRRAAGR